MSDVTRTLPLVWFERPLLPVLAPTIEAACTVLGPATEQDGYAGVELAVARHRRRGDL